MKFQLQVNTKRQDLILHLYRLQWPLLNLTEVIDWLKMWFFKLKNSLILVSTRLVSYEFESDLLSLVSSELVALRRRFCLFYFVQMVNEHHQILSSHLLMELICWTQVAKSFLIWIFCVTTGEILLL